MSIVEELETRFLPHLKKAAAELQLEFPSFRITTWSSPTGSLTAYQGHDVGIDCLLPDAAQDQPDNICLIIGVMHVTTVTKICDAAVCWGAGKGRGTELDLLDEHVLWAPEILSHIEVELPRLVGALRAALRRGHPLGMEQKI